MALLCASAVAAARLAPLAQPLAHSSRLVRSRVIRGAVEDAWSAAEDAALLERTPAFTCGDGASTVTFWSALAVATPALARRSPLECEERIALLAANATLAVRSYGRRPAVLDDWERTDDGRFVGTLEDQAVWLAPALEGCLASDPRPGPGYVQAVGGRILELGRPRVPTSTAPGALPAAPEPALSVAPSPPPASDRLSELATQIGATLLLAAAGLAASNPKPDPKPKPPKLEPTPNPNPKPNPHCNPTP